MKDLIGRSRNERKLDRIYNKQRDILIKQIKKKKEKDLQSTLSKRKLNEAVPFPEIYQKKKITLKKQNNGEENCQQGEDKKRPINLYNGIALIINKHIYSKSKFVKSINVFINLCLCYLNNEHKSVFFFAFDKIVKVFEEHYLHDEKEKTNNLYTFYKYDELHIKCMISLFDKVINKILDHRFVARDCRQNEMPTEQQPKRSAPVNEVEGETRRKETEEEEEEKEKEKEKEEKQLEEETEKEQKEEEKQENQKEQTCTNTTNMTNKIYLTDVEKKFLKMLKIKVYYRIVLYKLNDSFIFNKLMVIYKQIFEEILNDYKTYENIEIIEREKKTEVTQHEEFVDNHVKHQEKKEINNEHEKQYTNSEFSIDCENWKMPQLYEIYKMKKNAFTKCLSNLLRFFSIPWAKTSVEMLVQEVYRKSYIFDTCDKLLIENVQSAIKNNKNIKNTKGDSTHVLSIGETLNPVVDARDEKIVSIHGSHIWSNKQMEH